MTCDTFWMLPQPHSSLFVRPHFFQEVPNGSVTTTIDTITINFGVASQLSVTDILHVTTKIGKILIDAF